MSKLKSYAYINIGCITIIGLMYLLSKYPNTLGGMGGSFMLITVISGFILLTMVMKSLLIELSFIQLLLAGILGVNFLSYWEINIIRSIEINDSAYLIIFSICFLWVVFWYMVFIRLPFKKLDDYNETEQRSFKQISLFLFLPVTAFGIAFNMLSSLMFLSIRKYDPQVAIFNNPLFKLTYITIGWFVISFLVTLIYLSKIKDDDIKNLFIGDKCNIINYDSKKIKKYSLSTFILIIILGSIIETQRGMWVMWIETVLLIFLMSLIIWKIYKHVFFIVEEK